MNLDKLTLYWKLFYAIHIQVATLFIHDLSRDPLILTEN